MARHNNPLVVTSNLLLNLDFKNPKRFSTDLGTNLVQNQKYNASTWTNIFPANTTLTTGIDAPDGNNTAVRISCRTSGSSLLRVAFNAFTPNGTDTYTCSFWVRKISGSTSTSSQLWCDFADGTPSTNYVGSLITNTWVQVVLSAVPTATSKSFFDLLSDNTNDYVLDFWGLKIENQTTNTSTMPLVDSVSGYTFNLARPQYSSLSDSYVTFTRTASTPKWGGNISTVGTNSLTSANFLYADHSWEIWGKLNDITAGAYDANEQWSALAIYSGYHAGFVYTASTMAYLMWDNTGPTSYNACSWTVGISGAQINQGSWYQIIVTRSGNVFTPYLNGVQVGTGSTRAYTAFSGVSNNIRLGSAINATEGASSYVYYGKNSVANMKMYSRALSAAEISQNFNALRGRFGL